jgi:uncharacterized membrane protein (DUF106 family)
MASSDRRVQEFAGVDEELADAIDVVLARAEWLDSLEWADVEDALEPEQWGRLVGAGLLVSQSDGRYVVDDPDEARRIVEDPPTTPATSDDGWTLRDKVAGLLVLGLFASYARDPIRNAVATVIDHGLGPVLGDAPFYVVVLLLAITTSTYSSVLRPLLIDEEKVTAYQKRVSAIEEWKEEIENDEATEHVLAANTSLTRNGFAIMREKFRPMAWTLAVTLPALLWLRWQVDTGAVGGSDHVFVMPLLGPVEVWTRTVLHLFPAWLFLYALSSFVTTHLVKKLLLGAATS